MAERHAMVLGIGFGRSTRARTAPLVKSAFFRLGGCAVLREALPSRRVAILRYHSICSPDDCTYASPEICISPEAFEQHARYLAANYRVLPLGTVVERLRSNRPLPQNCVVITFDDGYADNLAAARALHRHGLSATVFITAACLAGGEPFWPAELRLLVAALRTPVVRFEARGQEQVFGLETHAERQAAIAGLTRLFKSVTIPEREALRDDLRRAAGHPALPECMLRWDELAEMAELGMTVGAHTLTHPNLPSVGAVEAAREIVGSRSLLERNLGCRVDQFSYPNGGAEQYYTPEIQAAVRDAGFVASATSRNGFAGLGSDLFALERVQVHERVEDLAFALEVERFAFHGKR